MAFILLRHQHPFLKRQLISYMQPQDPVCNREDLRSLDWRRGSGLASREPQGHAQEFQASGEDNLENW